MMDNPEYQQLERRRALAQALMQQTQQAPQGQMMGRVYAAPHPLEYLVQGLRNQGARNDLASSEKALTDYQTNERTRQGAEMTQFVDLLRGKKEQPAFEVPANEMDQQGYQMAPTPAVEANPMAAYGMAAGSRSPTMQRIGIQGMHDVSKERFKEAEEARKQKLITDALGRAKTPQEALAAGLPVELVKSYFDEGLGKTKGVVVNGQLVNPITAAKIGGSIPKQAAAPNLGTDLLIPGVDGKMTPNESLIRVKRELAQAGAARNTVKVDMKGEEEFTKELAKLDAKQLDSYRDQAEKSAGAIKRVEAMRGAVQGGVYSGSFADDRTKLANFFATIGAPGIDQKKLANSQEYQKHAKELVLSVLKEGVGSTNISNADLAFVNDTVPQLETSPEARTRLLDYIESRSAEQVKNYQAADSYARQNRGLGGYKREGLQPSKPNAPKPNKQDLFNQADAIIGGK
jgi:hypothetical protein